LSKARQIKHVKQQKLFDLRSFTITFVLLHLIVK
jgi:hypothetical protein